MTQKEIPAILKLKWESIEPGEITEVRHVMIGKQEFYAMSYAGNLIFTPEEIQKAHERFVRYPDVERTWHIWELSVEDIEQVAERLELNIEGLDHDDVAHYFKEAFNEGAYQWDEILGDAIKEAIAEKLIH